jgi:very-short-patch-repair endonuclease
MDFPLSETRSRLEKALLYTEALINLNTKLVTDIQAGGFPCFFEDSVIGLEGVDVNPEPGTYLRIRRLRETPPPELPEYLEDWVEIDELTSPGDAPPLPDARLIEADIDRLTELEVAGFEIDPADVLERIPPDPAGIRRDLYLRTVYLPELVQGYREYVTGPWAQWVATERPRRRSIELYNRMFQIFQRSTGLGADNPIDLVFGVGMARWRVAKALINIPLIEQLVELHLADNGDLSIVPRNKPPRLDIGAFQAADVEGLRPFEGEIAAKFDAIAADPERGFNPFDIPSYDLVLRACAARISATGCYVPDEVREKRIAPEKSRAVPPAGDTLHVTDSWVLYVRAKNENYRRQDIQQLVDQVQKTAAQGVPPVGRRLVNPPDDQPVAAAGDGFDLRNATLKLPSGPGSSAMTSSASANEDAPARPERTFFFPLPHNDTQISIAERLEDEEGVIVQGPPGTGKTHTIANIIAHYLATNRRVIVAAKTPQALTAIRGNLPPSIRDLAISIIHNDVEGNRQLEAAIHLLADQAKNINPATIERELMEKQARIAALIEEIAEIDARLAEYARYNAQPLLFRGADLRPMEIARIVAAERAAHAWFPDRLDLVPAHEPRFTAADVAAAYDIRRRLKADLVYTAAALPDPATLPPLAQIIAAHGELQAQGKIAQATERGDLPAADFTQVSADEAAAAIADIEALALLFADMAHADWQMRMWRHLSGVDLLPSEARDPLRSLLVDWRRLAEEGAALLLQGHRTPPDSLDDPALEKALADLAAGRRPFGAIGGMFAGGLKQKLACFELEGRKPVDTGDWQSVRARRIWEKAVRGVRGRWAPLSRAVGAPSDIPDDEAFVAMGRLFARLQDRAESLVRLRDVLRRLFPYGVDVVAVVAGARLPETAEAIRQNLARQNAAGVEAIPRALKDVAGDHEYPLHGAIRTFAANLGNRKISQTSVSASWNEIVAEARRLAPFRPDLGRLEGVCAAVAASGAPEWAALLRAPDEADTLDNQTPPEWRAAWEWSRADGFLRRTSDRRRLVALSSQRAAKDDERKRLFVEIIKLRTFYALKKKMAPRVEVALQKFVSAIARLGRGTGITAPRQRRIIREAMSDIASAIPCWILPESRVAEHLPAELGAFDLVIVDEASQSDITALPVLLRGKKTLIVGDDQQVSPTPVGLEDRQIVQLREKFLAGLPFAHQMDPATSLYELGAMLFPGKSILLREHFRCVEPIIRYSSRFYPLPLIPLRLPSAADRLDPPLVDIHVPHGVNIGKVNEAEAQVIVDEIGRLVEDPAFAERKIGVISLIGDQQAKRINDLLLARFGGDIFKRHEIMCGNAYTYQGQERDIMFLSMVACPKTTRAHTTRMMAQRLNVAMSRARDRLVLVRSVDIEHLKPEDLKFHVLEHFRDPMLKGNVGQSRDILDACESEFERDFGGELLARGYRLRPQVSVGEYRIDFVVEGAGDARLAIELDGDAYHGPERWADDFRRQKTLERVGWSFWRCWGSSWVADREGCLDDLFAAFRARGIEPLGAETKMAIYTEHRRILPGPMGAEGTADGQPEEPDTEDSENNTTVAVGDRLTVRYNDDIRRSIHVTLTTGPHDPRRGLISVDDPLGKAVLGLSVEDEFEIEVNGLLRKGLIEKIEKAGDMAAA